MWSHSFDKQGCDFTLCSGVGWNTFKVSYSLPSLLLSSLCNTSLCLNWMSAFLKQPWSNTRSTLWIKWGKTKTFEKTVLYDSITLQYLQPFLETITLKYSWNLAPSAYSNKDYSKDFKKIVTSPHFLHLTSINLHCKWKCFKVHDVLQLRMALHCNFHDSLKLGSNIQTLLDCYMFTLLIRLIGILKFDISYTY